MISYNHSNSNYVLLTCDRNIKSDEKAIKIKLLINSCVEQKLKNCFEYHLKDSIKRSVLNGIGVRKVRN